jgi:hypothetical protein
MIEYVDKENKISYSLTFNDKDKELIHKKYADTIKLFIEKIYIPKLVENAIVGINYQKKREFLK